MPLTFFIVKLVAATAFGLCLFYLIGTQGGQKWLTLARKRLLAGMAATIMVLLAATSFGGKVEFRYANPEEVMESRQARLANTILYAGAPPSPEHVPAVSVDENGKIFYEWRKP